jgi:hypothetical protein
VDREFGARIRELLEAGPVWVVESPTNRESVQKVWAEFPECSHLEGVTIFDSVTSDPVKTLINVMGTIDLHHGVYSADPAYTVIRAIGCELNPEIREALAEFGFDLFSPTDAGFEAIRPLPRPLGE